jgi:acyl-CoA synthetase (AMP-forming)/AMP-acid ligase II
MIDGEMQPYALTLDKFIDHAAKWHPRAEVVTAVENGEPKRITYAALRERAKRVSSVLAERGVRFGTRVATLAWNTQGHVEAWYGIMAMGAVCHTLNPRLTATQLAWMLRQSEAHILIVSADLMPLARAIAEDRRKAFAPDARSRHSRICSTLRAAMRRGVNSTSARRADCVSPRERPVRRRASRTRIARASCTRCDSFRRTS